jgi:hypothetical protein
VDVDVDAPRVNPPKDDDDKAFISCALGEPGAPGSSDLGYAALGVITALWTARRLRCGANGHGTVR